MITIKYTGGIAGLEAGTYGIHKVKGTILIIKDGNTDDDKEVAEFKTKIDADKILKRLQVVYPKGKFEIAGTTEKVEKTEAKSKDEVNKEIAKKVLAAKENKAETETKEVKAEKSI